MVKKLFPFLGWFTDYSIQALKIDAIAGLTVALVLIPQSMAYAQLAGLPAYYGLYASFLPPMIAALFGSSRQLATGPVAVVSLMTAASLAPLATTGSEGYIAYAVLLALLVGIFQLSLGILRLGLVVNFLSHPVVNGFTNAAAIIIASSQLSKMFGVYVDTSAHHYETILHVIQAAVHYTHWPTLIMGGLAFGIMYGLKILNPKIPNVLVAVTVTTLASWALGFEHNQTVSLSQITSDKIKQEISRFNSTVKRIQALSGERTDIVNAFDHAVEEHDKTGQFDAKHDTSVVNYHLDQLKAEQSNLRSHLRWYHFHSVIQTDGTARLYLSEKLPPEAKPDSRIWRLKIGNRSLDTQALLFTGGGAVVGMIPKGLPALSMPAVNLKVMLQLFPYAVIISLLGFMEAISIAKAMAAKTGQRLDPNQELIGQGLSNILGSAGQSYPVSGSFSRSAVNLQAGARTGLSSFFTTVMVVVVLLFFTPLLYHLPQAVLAAVIMMAVIGLVNVTGFVHSWRAQWYDGLISVIAFVATLAFAPHLDKGIMIGVVLSLMVFLYKSMRPKVVSLARAEDEALRCVETHGLRECDYIAMIRFDGPLFFANASYLEDKITAIMSAKDKLHHIIIVSNGINDVDASGEEALSLLVDRVRSAGVDISLTGVNEAVMRVFKRTHVLEKIGEDHIFPTMEQAIYTVHDHIHEKGDESECPLTTVCRLVES